MKYYVDIVYIMIVNGVLISKDKNKVIVGERYYLWLKKLMDYLMVKKANGLSNQLKRDQALRILK